MLRGRRFALIIACAGLALPSAAFAQGAGDDQYLDPLEGLTGSNHAKEQTRSETTSSSEVPSTAATPITTTTATEEPKAKSKSKATTVTQPERAALDIKGLSGIGTLVAVPVKHVTLVIGDIAHGRG